MKTIIENIYASNNDDTFICCFKLFAYRLDSGHCLFDIYPTICIGNGNIPNRLLHMKLYSYMKICEDQESFDDQIKYTIDNFSGSLLPIQHKENKYMVHVKNNYTELYMRNNIYDSHTTFQLITIQDGIMTEYILPSIQLSTTSIDVMERKNYDIHNDIYLRQLETTKSVEISDIETVNESTFTLIEKE